MNVLFNFKVLNFIVSRLNFYRPLDNIKTGEFTIFITCLIESIYYSVLNIEILNFCGHFKIYFPLLLQRNLDTLFLVCQIKNKRQF